MQNFGYLQKDKLVRLHHLVQSRKSTGLEVSEMFNLWTNDSGFILNVFKCGPFTKKQGYSEIYITTKIYALDTNGAMSL